MFALEHLSDDFKKKEETVPTIEKLELQQRRWRDDYELNKIVRDKVGWCGYAASILV